MKKSRTDLPSACEHWVVQDLEEEFEFPPKQLIKAHKDLLLDALEIKDVSQITLGKIEGYVLSDHELDTAIEGKKFLVIFCIYWAWKIARTKERLLDPEEDRLHNMYLLGAFRERLRITTHELKYFDSDMDWHSSLKGRLAISKRWSPQEHGYEKALNLADQLWSTGDKSLRHEMARHLKEKFANLSLRQLQKRLTPLAEKHGMMYDPRRQRLKRPFTVECFCKDCAYNDVLIKKEDYEIINGDEQNGIATKCPECERYCQYNIFWPTGEEEENLDMSQALDSIEEYNKLARLNS